MQTDNFKILSLLEDGLVQPSSNMPETRLFAHLLLILTGILNLGDKDSLSSTVVFYLSNETKLIQTTIVINSVQQEISKV